MKKSRVLTLGLACFLTAVTAFGALAATSGGGGVYSHLNDTSCAKNAHTQKFSQTTPQNANNAQNGLINPQDNDPVVFTTDYGLEIKYANALTNTNLAGYTYFTMGSYDTNNDGVDEPINWVIIGRHSKDFAISKTNSIAWHAIGNANYYPIISWLNNSFECETSCGLALYNDNIFSDDIAGGTPLVFSTSEATSDKIDTELDPGEVLVISENSICSAAGGNNYDGSAVKNKMESLFESELHFTDIQKKLIMPQDLTNYGVSTTNTYGAYLFPLASRGENFNASTYLNQTQRGSSGAWWTRSGHSSNSSWVHLVFADGSFSNENSTSANSFYGPYAKGVRPVFVMKLI